MRNTTSTGFILQRRCPIAALRLELQDYLHPKTGARHLHLASDDPHNAFLVAFLTVPQDSTGVAHILEHTVLCGSRRYPVRDPFFMMIRRSLNTFMNAFTSSDWTAYPFASQNQKDFNNLLDVYLDAAFFPQLHELDFAQEGWRIEFSEPTNPDTPLVYKGIVFNEMKGALSSPIQRLGQLVQTHLFPTTTYHHNSGGDPAVIPTLTYAQLKAFHAQHYHPSNAIFMTYGNIPAAAHQARFDSQVLQHFDRLKLQLAIADEQRYSQPQIIEAHYPLDSDDVQKKTHIVMGWLLGKTTDAYEVLQWRLLSDVLLDNSSSPLRHALETSEWGTAPSALCGFDAATRETTFVCGLEGSEPEHAEAVEQMILSVLQEVADKGVPPEQLAAMVHQLELQQREITGDGFPYGLHLLLTALTPALHGGDPAAALDLDPLLSRLREESGDPDFIPRLIRRWLLDNPHRIRLTMKPEAGLHAKQLQAEQQQLDQLRATLTAKEQQTLIEQAQALQTRQAQVDDPDILPKVTLADVPAELPIPTGQSQAVGAYPATWYARATNGLVYVQWIVDLPQLTDSQTDLLPLLTQFVSEVGSGGRDYRQTQALQAAVTGGLSARTLARSSVHHLHETKSVLALGGKALVRNQAALLDLLYDTWMTARFDELPRLRELVSQLRTHKEESMTDQGHGLAMLAASAAVSPVARLIHRQDGLEAIKRLKELDDQLDDAPMLETLAQQLTDLMALIRTLPGQWLVVSEFEHHEAFADSIATRWKVPTATHTPSSVPLSSEQTAYLDKQGFSINTQVNFCAKVYPTVAAAHPDAPVLQVLGEVLRHGYLHRALREQGGAYGGGAGYHNDTGVFRFYSYRDPRLQDTLADFDRALAWLCDAKPDAQALEEAILSVIGQIDKPGSPAGEAIGAFFHGLFGRTATQRQQFRQRVLAVTWADLQRVGATYFLPRQARIAVISDAATWATQTDFTVTVI